MKDKILSPLSMFVAGLLLGVVSRLLDIYTQSLGDMFSQLSVWILIGTVISIYSKTEKKAMVNVFLLSIGMLITYYTVVYLTHGWYDRWGIIGWTVFACLTPFMAFFAWMAKEEGIFPKIISIGIVICSVLSSILLFDGPRLYDFVINALLVYFLFFSKVDR
ncbi:hypothetical protein Cst_c06920 [Thermoclostridium stercorarium subsp. stercorarium DSM 8532]|jgi:hypothetical protein|uniref:Permease n=2 Tax=Thermoclostridium stercorarium TaxID=1510 RepID=L7VML9_THES1|nr:DUF6518 family protein [Thermoclostridium stercorarium]AGC67706.1 hypothetical protein Cst_c06920 [Thermoclostridium stercorarium subsp. stercorarium DSM 8532]AGI38751.1 hypothetical protein Clst_0659 [Thermoclostridium stercorarium subsp. stercorarium DSM 8532]ANX00663.1 hypothetical protein CSTERLE_03185 [Thermoclostridium stercorarium subsp. leptospartum DSM 9219]